MDNEKKIYVYADFLTYKNYPVGVLHVSSSKGKEFYSFEYDNGETGGDGWNRPHLFHLFCSFF